MKPGQIVDRPFGSLFYSKSKSFGNQMFFYEPRRRKDREGREEKRGEV
ncbi:hypothetical protein QT998_03770 [Microcoleus sp. S1D4]